MTETTFLIVSIACEDYHTHKAQNIFQKWNKIGKHFFNCSKYYAFFLRNHLQFIQLQPHFLQHKFLHFPSHDLNFPDSDTHRKHVRQHCWFSAPFQLP